jgi:two-component system CheB/CheR fusion protein
MRVLIVERDPDARGLVAAAVRLAGAQTMEAESVEEALARCLESVPDVILADLALPGADGHILIGKMRASVDSPLSHIPVLAITGYADDPDRVQTATSGLQAELATPPTPPTPESLVNTVARAVARH